MDIRQLADLYSTGNFALWGPGGDAFNLDQQQQQAKLQSVLGEEQRAAQMHPLDMQHKEATTRYNNINADIQTDSLKAKGPLEDRLKASVAERLGKSSAEDIARLRGEMSKRRQLGAIAQANGGTFPLNMQHLLTPEEAPYFKDKNTTALTMKLLDAFDSYSPESLKTDRKIEEIKSRPIAAGRVGGGGKSGSVPGPGKTDIQEAVRLEAGAANLPDGPVKQAMLSRAQEHRTKHAKDVILKAEARLAGKTTLEVGADGKPKLVTAPMPSAGGQQAPTWSPPPGFTIKQK